MVKDAKTQLETSKIKSKCVRLLVKRDHSVFELRQKLTRYYEFSDEAFKEAIEWLKQKKFLADEADLARRWAEQYQKQGRGRHWIAAKLKTKGLQLEMKDGDSEMEAARKALSKKLRNKSLDELDYEDKQRLGRQLTNRGFSTHVVRELLK